MIFNLIRVREGNTLRRIHSAPLLQTQNFRRKNVNEFLAVSDFVFYYFHIIS